MADNGVKFVKSRQRADQLGQGLENGPDYQKNIQALADQARAMAGFSQQPQENLRPSETSPDGYQLRGPAPLSEAYPDDVQRQAKIRALMGITEQSKADFARKMMQQKLDQQDQDAQFNDAYKEFQNADAARQQQAQQLKKRNGQ